MNLSTRDRCYSKNTTIFDFALDTWISSSFSSKSFFLQMNPQQQHQFHQQFQQQQQGQMRGGQGPVIRPSPIPANAPTEHDILAEMAMRHSEQQQQFRMPHGLPPGGLPPNGPPPTGGIQPSRDDVLMMAAQRKLIPELLKSPEANSLQAAVQNQGMNMLNTILYQFVYGQMEPTRREILLQVS